jgi:FkbM family methyltransferase
VRAILKPANYSGVLKTLRGCSSPMDFLRRYVLKSGKYPVKFHIQTPIGAVSPTAFLPDDILTINEIFFRADYGDDRDARTVVDFGSNIGISALYFLSRNRECRVYCFEPLAQNVERLKVNLIGFEDRYELQEMAVATDDGVVEFGWEATGRYGGIGRPGLPTISVPAVDSNRVLKEIIKVRGEIDLLKIDIEELEYELTARIPSEIATRVRRIVVEQRFRANPLAATHRISYKHPITTFERLPQCVK